MVSVLQKWQQCWGWHGGTVAQASTCSAVPLLMQLPCNALNAVYDDPVEESLPRTWETWVASSGPVTMLAAAIWDVN